MHFVLNRVIFTEIFLVSMAPSSVEIAVNQILKGIERLIPEYMNDPVDKKIADGNLAICIIDQGGSVFGKMYGTDKPRMRRSYKIAWTKASQVWLTGVKTGEYEKLVFTGVIPENSNGIENPDLIGWEGGQPVKLANGLELAIGFSGFRGTTDLAIVVRAISEQKI
jgi:glc operon protein GlcG